MNILPKPPATIELIELNNETSLDDVYFIKLLEATSPLHDEEKAKKYALDNWAGLNSHSKKMYDWVFGRESRLKGWMTRRIEAEPLWISRAIDNMEGDLL